MDPKTPSNTPIGQNDLSYQVMPHEGGGNPTYTPPTEAQQGSVPPPQVPTVSLSEEPAPPSGSSRLPYIIIAVAVLAALGALAYFLLGAKKNETEQQTRLPKTWMSLYFNKEECDDQNTCGDEADPDTDGLSNYDEFKNGVIPINPDTDKDGLADGDEVNIYKTDPQLLFTDRREIVAQNQWTDGYQVKNGFDPVNPNNKFSEVRLKQIADDTVKFQLHEPTITTLK